MKLVSLKQKYSDLSKPIGAESDEYYPTLHFDETQLEALSVKASRVGTDMVMMARVRVASLSESKAGFRSMSIEILEAAIKPKENEPDAASVLFPNG